jgi:hypothetical protein
MRRAALVLALAAALGGCVMVPVTVDGYDGRCRVVTHHMELQAVQVASIQHCANEACVGMVIVAAGVVAASAVVSGSVVVIGNIAYWAERQANCLAAPAPPPPVVVPDPAAPQ